MPELSLTVPDTKRFTAANNVTQANLPRFAPAPVERSVETITDVQAAGRVAVAELPEVDSLASEAEALSLRGVTASETFPR